MFALQFLAALAVILLTTRVVGYAFQRIAQPAVIGELVGGILLGPSLLGWIAPGVFERLFPPAIVPLLQVHAQAGVIIFMFLVGLELDLRAIRNSGSATVAISNMSIILPFALGYALAHPLHERFAPSQRFLPFALFLGVSMAVTAFPVLARILRDRRIDRTRMGALALACAAVGDVTAWSLLVVVVAISEFGNLGRALSHIPGLIVEHLHHYAIFAAFFLGAVMPGRSRIPGGVHDRLAGIVSAFFLPVFFAFSGLRTQVGLIEGLTSWIWCSAIIAVACAGKFGGGTLAARFVGIGWRDAVALGVLLNTRGLVELIVLNVGLDLGIVTPTLFTMLVLMALATTFMTSPLLQWLLKSDPWLPEADPQTRSQASAARVGSAR
jgi:Kef-type K+ transport system membrane component KefB